MKTNMPSKAMILAAGRGERMRPLTDSTPKPLVKVAGKPIIEYSLELLRQSKIKEAVVNVSYLAEQLQDYLVDKTNPHVQVSWEDKRLETGGGIAKALPLLGEQPFFALNGDIIIRDSEFPLLERMANIWNENKMDILMALIPRDQTLGYEGEGDFFLLENGSLKRRGNHKQAPYVFTGVQLIHPRVFTQSPKGAFSMNIIYDKKRQSDGHLPNIYGIVHTGKWLHVGNIAAIELSEDYLLNAAA